MLRGRRLGLMTAAWGLALVVATPAAAAWVVAASGAAAAGGTTVNPPTAPTSTVTGSSVTLSWTAPAAGATPSGYTVQRTAPTATIVCVAVAATTCTDTGLSPTTTYTYAVTALAQLWQSTPLAATATTATPLPSAFLVTPSTTTTTAGMDLTVTIQARKTDGTNDTTYNGFRALTFSGPGTIGGNAPVYPAGGTFDAGGLATVTVRLYRAETVTITVADGDPVRTGVSPAVTVLPGTATRLRWTTDAAGLIDACPTGTVVVGVGGQRSWYVAVLDVYGNRAIQGAASRQVDVTRLGGGGQSAGNPPTTPLAVPAGANPAVSSTTSLMKLKKKNPAATTYRATSAGVTAVSCTLSP